MALITFQQTDEVSPCAPMAACAPAPSSPIEAPLVDASMRADGTAGATEETMDIPAGSSVYKAFFQSGQVGQVDWPGGDWTVNINISTAQNDITLSGVWVCRIQDDCTPDVAVGSNTTSFDASAAGVISVPVTGTLTSGLTTDRVYIVCEFTNGHTMNARTVGITPSETVASPIPEPTPIAPAAEGLSLAEPSPAIDHTVPVSGTVTTGGAATEGAVIDITDTSTDTKVGRTTTEGDGSFLHRAASDGPFEVTAQHDDGTTTYNSQSHHSVMPPDPAPTGSASYELRYDGPGIDLTMLTDPAWEPQGVCYAESMDRWYVAEVTDTTTPSTIHEFTEDGVATGNTFQFATATPNPNHANSLVWHDGHLWCAEYNSDTVYKIDWAAKAVVGSFTLGNGVVDGDKLGAITFVPTSRGTYKLLASMWGSTSTAVYFVNPNDAIADGTATGNIYRTLSDAIDTGRLQGLLYDNGRLYVTHDAMPNGNPPSTAGWGSYPVLKLAFPYADSFVDGDPLIAGRYVWQWLTRIPYDDPIQGIGLNPSNGTFWVCSEALGQIHSGGQKKAVNHLSDSWNDWQLHDFSGPNDDWQKSIELNNAVASGKRDQHLYMTRQPADVEVWIHDDLADVGTADEKRTYVSVAEPQNVHNDTENALAINSAQSGTEYVAWNSTDSWHLTGVTRPSSPQWIKFRWQMDGSQTTTSISKDGGATWTTIKTYTHSATALGVLIPQVSTGTPTYLGPFTITPR